MENQDEKIIGYKDLTQGEIKLINKVKSKGEELGVLLKELEDMDSIDKRWLAIGKTDLQKGLMAINRSITKPTTF